MTKLATVAATQEMGEPLAGGVKLSAEELLEGEEGEEPEATDVAEPEPPEPEKKSIKPGKSPIDLTKLPEFREWQAKSDQRIADAEKRAAEAKRQADAVLADRATVRQKEILAALAKPGFADESQIRQLLDEYVAAREQATQGAKSEWEQAKSKLISEAGLKAEDFPDDRYKDDPGTAWFRLVAEVQAAADAGFLDADTGGDGESLEGDDAEWFRDLSAVQTGKMSSKTYLKKWGSKEV